MVVLRAARALTETTRGAGRAARQTRAAHRSCRPGGDRRRSTAPSRRRRMRCRCRRSSCAPYRAAITCQVSAAEWRVTWRVIDSAHAVRHRGGMTTAIELIHTRRAAGARSLPAAPTAGRRSPSCSRHVHGRPRLLHRQRRAALHAARPARRHRRDRMGRGRLRADLRRVPDHGGAARRPDRPAADVLDRARAVHARLGRVRGGRHADRARGRAARAGGRRRAHHAQRALDHRRHLHRCRPPARARHLRARDGSGRGVRTTHRWRPDPGRHRRARLARLLPDQRPGRGRRARAGAEVRVRVTLGAASAARSASARCC